jgi:Uma2 family endonuclease
MPDLPEDAWIELSPDWVCEVLSPSTAQTDRSIKLPVYAERGVRHCWLVDPGVKTLDAYELMSGRWTLLVTLSENDSVRLPPFDAIAFSLEALWP